MVYDMLTEAPAPGTPMESLMMMVWRMRQDVLMSQTRALVQAVCAAASEGEDANKNLQTAWTDYVEELFPFRRGQTKKADVAAIDYLKQEVAKGPLRVIPLQPVGRATSKLKARQVAREGEKARVVRFPGRKRRRR